MKTKMFYIVLLFDKMRKVSMERMKLSLMVLGAMSLLALFSSGCATSRGILDVRIPDTPNMEYTTSVKITKVTDSRKFELKPNSAAIPSLKDGQINNDAITSRAIARKRNAFGKAMGDILLPEGRRVEDLAKEAVQEALKKKGYSIAERNTPEYAKAVPVEVDIRQFWSWGTPGFWAFKLEFEAIVTIRSKVVSSNSEEETVRGYVLLHTQAATSRAWMNTIQKGLEILIDNIKANLRAPQTT